MTVVQRPDLPGYGRPVRPASNQAQLSARRPEACGVQQPTRRMAEVGAR
jgi:hypothetical protein